MKDNIVETDNPEDVLPLSTLYEIFKYWYKESHTENKCPNRSELKTNLEEKFGKIKSINNKPSWRNIKLKSSNNTCDLDK